MNAVEYYTWRMNACLEAVEYYYAHESEINVEFWHKAVVTWQRKADEYKAKLEVSLERAAVSK